MQKVTLSLEEATRVLNLMRTLQMNLAMTERATHPVEAEVNPLFSVEFAGELNTLINSVEGSIFEAGIPDSVRRQGEADAEFLRNLPKPN